MKKYQLSFILLTFILGCSSNGTGKMSNNNTEMSPNKLIDIDSNVYKTITIGKQTWMAENLKVTRYANGAVIPHITDNTAWANLGDNDTDKGYSYQNNNANKESDLYGALYTYAAATNGDNSSNNVQGVCPKGWHLPSDEEWKALEIGLGMSTEDANDTSWRGTDQGSQLAGNAGLWVDGILENNLNFGSSNFSGVPGGSRYDYNGAFVNIGIHGYWWTSTQKGSKYAFVHRIDHRATTVFRFEHAKSYGISVRCVKD